MSYTIPTLSVALAAYDRVAQREAAQADEIAAAQKHGESTGCYVDYDGLQIELDNAYANQAHNLAESVRHLLPVLERFADVMCEAGGDTATAFTCTEAEAIAAVFRSIGDHTTAGRWIDAHAEGDDEGDDHYRPENNDGLLSHPFAPHPEDVSICAHIREDDPDATGMDQICGWERADHRPVPQLPEINAAVFVGGAVVPHPFVPWANHAACADCHGAQHAKLGDNRRLHPLP